MATLKFNAKKVEKLVQHALAAVQHTRSYGQNNDPVQTACMKTKR